MEKADWHCGTAQQALDFWQSSPQEGLSSSEAKRRLAHFGPNHWGTVPVRRWWKGLLKQFTDVMVLILMAAAAISLWLGEYTDGVTILMIVAVNALLGFAQEYRAEQSLAALKKITAQTARVIRNGERQEIAAAGLVPGDIMVLETGDRIAADARLITAYNLAVDEAVLTGESAAAEKQAECCLLPAAPPADRCNMLYAGTAIVKGRGTAVVCAAGLATEMGRIAAMIKEEKTESTPLERRLAQLGRWLVAGCLLLCVLVVAVGVLQGQPVFLMCLAGISLAVAAIPEGLPAVVTVALAVGVQRLIKCRAIVRKLPAVETLGCVTVICSDKTGTLTQSAMTVRRMFCGGALYEVTGSGYNIKGNFLLNKQEFLPQKDKSLLQCLKISVLCNNSQIKRNHIGIGGWWRENAAAGWTVEGDPTEGALAVAAAKANIWRGNLEKKGRRLAESPFAAERRRMSVVYEEDGVRTLYVKGAPDVILALCSRYDSGQGQAALTAKEQNSIAAAGDEMAGGMLRVLATAYRQLRPEEKTDRPEVLETELVFSGLLGMIDPPRPEARQAIACCRRAGIRTVMITGDHLNTALAIAEELRLFRRGEDMALTGEQLEAMSDAQLAAAAEKTAVYARVSPGHKLRIVRALQRLGHIVAMTGDGINDAPAVKEADIGIAMGQSGTDVTREAASLVLADDNFATIVAAIQEGRGIYENIRKFIRYLLACNLGEVLTMFVAAVAGLPLPLLPVQILWVNLVTDGLPALALGIDPQSRSIMERPPRPPRESVFSRGLSRKIAGRGLQIGLSTAAVFAAAYWWGRGLAAARTMAFCTLVFSQIFHVFDCRNEHRSLRIRDIFRNPWLLAATAASAVMQLLAVYSPWLGEVFLTVPLLAGEWLVVLAVSGWNFAGALLRQLAVKSRRPAWKTDNKTLKI